MGKKTEKAGKRSSRGGNKANYDTILIFRLVLASVIFAFSLIFASLPKFVSTLFLAVAAVIAGYDIVIDAVVCALQRDFFASPLIVVFITVVSYIIGFAVEGAALVVLYQIGLMLIAYAEERTRLSALELLQYQDEATVNRMTELVCHDGAGYMTLETAIGCSAGSVLKLAIIFGLIYAIVLPIITSYSLTVSIHRAMTIILIATPVSMLFSMPLTGIVAMCFSAKHGVIFHDAEKMEAVADAGTAIFDSAGIFTDDLPRVAEIKSDLLDQTTFLTFAAHALYNSRQSLAKAISAIYIKDYQPELISNFQEIPGYGVELDIGGAHVVLAIRELFNGRGVKLPPEPDKPGQHYYMTVADRYVGSITLYSQLNNEAEDIVVGMREAGIHRCVLVCEDGNMESRRIAEEMDFHEVYGGCDAEKKLRLVEDIKTASSSPVIYVFPNIFQISSSADVQVTVGRRGQESDVLVSPDYLANLPFAVQICKRMKEIAIENAVFVFVIKAILIFLSMIGYCNIWFAIFIDTAAALATILNSIRVTQESLINAFLYKTGRK